MAKSPFSSCWLTAKVNMPSSADLRSRFCQKQKQSQSAAALHPRQTCCHPVDNRIKPILICLLFTSTQHWKK